MQSLIVLVFLLTIFGTISGIFQDVIFPIQNQSNEAFELVDIQVIVTDTFPNIDLKFQNNTDRPIYIYEIESKTLNSWYIESNICYDYVPSSFSYELFLAKGKDEASTIKASQVIQPNSVDRFSIIVGGNSKSYRGLSPYLFTLNFKYGDNNSLTTNSILINIPVQGEYRGSYNPGPSLEQVQNNYETSLKILKEINSSTIIDTLLLKILKYYSEIDSIRYKNEYLE